MSEQAKGLYAALSGALGQVVVGQEEAMEGLAVALLAGGHVLLEGVPGVAKTLLARSFAAALSLTFRRVQFTPDLMPSDITGTRVYRSSKGEFELERGPLFTQILLADEINRAPPKTQAALLEAMQERQVTLDGERHDLGPLFTVVATQNPLEYEGTYPLPEAETDRFLLKLVLTYPPRDEEVEILRRHVGGGRIEAASLEPVCDAKTLLAARAEVARLTVDETVLRYVVALAEASRTSARIRLGTSPRASVALLMASRARAAIQGRDYVTPDDVKAIAPAVLRHRLVLRPEAEIEGLTVDDVIGGLLHEVEVPR